MVKYSLISLIFIYAINVHRLNVYSLRTLYEIATSDNSSSQ